MSPETIVRIIFFGLVFISIIRSVLRSPAGAEILKGIQAMFDQNNAGTNGTTGDPNNSDEWLVLDEDGNPIGMNTPAPNPNAGTQIQQVFQDFNFAVDREEIEENVNRVLWWGLAIMIIIALAMLVPILLLR